MTDTLITVDLQFQKLLQRAREGQAAGREVQVDREQQRKVEAAGRAERGVRERITIPGQVLQQGRSRRGVHSSPQNVTKRPKEQPAAGYVQQGTIGLWGPAMPVADRNNRSFSGWVGVGFVPGPKQQTLDGIAIYSGDPSGLLTPKSYKVLQCIPYPGQTPEESIVILVEQVLLTGVAQPGTRPAIAPFIPYRIPRQRLKRDKIYAVVVYYEPVPDGQPYPLDRYNFIPGDSSTGQVYPGDAGLSWNNDFSKVSSNVEALRFSESEPVAGLGVSYFTTPSVANTLRFRLQYSAAPIINGFNVPRSRPTWWRPLA
jgi:hypothetical protein